VRIYVAGPYTKGGVAVNVRNAILAGEALVQKGHTPFIPHLTHLWHIVIPHDVQFWYDYDMHWLKECDALLRIPGESIGADKEEAFALLHRFTVYHHIDEVPQKTITEVKGGRDD